MCPHCAAIGAIALVTSIPFIKPTVRYYRAKKAAKKAKEKTDAAEE